MKASPNPLSHHICDQFKNDESERIIYSFCERERDELP